MARREKVKIPLTTMAYNMYRIFVKDAVKGARKDLDGEIILLEEEQRLLLLTFVCDLLEAKSMGVLKLELLLVYLRDTQEVEGEPMDQTDELLILTAMVIGTSCSMQVLTKKNLTLFEKGLPDFCEGLNQTQIALAVSWYTGHTEAITPVFRLLCKDYEMSDAYYCGAK